MHELSIALSILEMVEDEAEKRGGIDVVAVHLKLGPLAGVVKESLASAYELAREYSPLAKTRLVIEDVPIIGYCQSCRAEREVVSVQDIRCAVCGAATPRLVSGRELEVSALEIQ
jgi:hydrogenase nickel incorporation protein HypA/HybF